MSNVNWDDLRFLLAVLRATSMSRASEELGVTTATVSRRLTTLEACLNTTLVRRSSRGSEGIEVTAAGFDILHEIEERVLAFERLVAGADQRLEGRIVLSAPEGLFAEFLMETVADFTRAHPAVSVETVSSDAFEDLTRGEPDLVVRVGNDPGDDLVGRRVARIAHAVYGASSYLEACRSGFKEMLWIGWRNRTLEMEWRAGRFEHLPLRHRVGSSTEMLEAVKAGLGVSRIECYRAESVSPLVRVDDGEPRFTKWVWVLMHPDLKSNQRVRAMAAHLAAAFDARKTAFESDAVSWLIEPL